MQLTTLRYIVTVADLGSFTQAAELLFVSQPALSQAIRRFELDLHAELFIRKKGNLCLTPIGELVVATARKMLALEDELHSQIAQAQAQSQSTLTIGAATSYLRFFLTPILSEVQRRAPDTRIITKDGYTSVLCEQVLSNKLDFALVFEPILKGVDSLPVLHEEIFLAVPWDHPLNAVLSQSIAPNTQYPVADLTLCREAEFIVYQPGRRIQDILMETTQKAGFTPKVSATCVSTESANLMAFHGMGLAFVPAVTAQLCDKAYHPRYYRLKENGLYRTMNLINLPDKKMTSVQSLLISILHERSQHIHGLIGDSVRLT